MRDYDQNEPVPVMDVVENAYQTLEKEYVRPRMDYLRDYEIGIRFLSLGCIRDLVYLR
jgi:hypothetical protein